MTLRKWLEQASRHALPLPCWQASFVLEHGRPFTPRPLPPKVKHGRSGLCFKNCAMSMGRDLIYCEGFARHKDFPIHHAWLATPDGFVVDRTWTGGHKRPELGREYFGVPFKTEFVAVQALKDRGFLSLLNNWRHDWPLWNNCPPIEDFLYRLPE